MNKRSVVLIITICAAIGFGAGAMFYKKTMQPETPVAPQVSEQGGGYSLPAVASNDTLVRDHSPVLGPATATVTIVEFFDPSCESCRAVYPIAKDVMSRYPNDVKLVLRYTPFHQGSDEAVAIIEAARWQGVFIPVLEALLKQQPEWAKHGHPDLARAWDIAAEAGLNVEKAKEDIVKLDVPAMLKKEMDDVRANNIRGTPTFFVNGRQMTSLGHKQLVDAIDNELAAAKGKQ